MTRVFRGLCLAIAAAAAGCGSAAPPSTTTPPRPNDPGLTITGSEHLGWTQTGDDADRYVYVLYVDEARYELSRTSCAPSAPQVFDCQSPLPPITNGTHSLQLTAAIRDGDALLEGSRSVPLVVTVTGSAGAQSITIVPAPPTATRTATDGAAAAGPSCGFAEWDASHVLAWTSGGELVVASRDRRAPQILAWTNEAGGDWRLSAVVLHIEQSKRLVFVTLTSIGAEPRLRVLRYRELHGVLGERATIVDIPLSAPAATVNASFAPDGRLSIAVTRHALAAAPEPFVVTAALDGATPIDMDPRLVSRAPLAGTWDGNGHFWIVERNGSGISARVGDTVIARLSLAERDAVVGVQALDSAGTSGIAIFTSRGKGWLLSQDGTAPQQPAAISFFRGNDGSYQSMLTLEEIVFGCAAMPTLSLDYAKWVHSTAMQSRRR